jgi:hypothetical protein
MAHRGTAEISLAEICAREIRLTQVGLSEKGGAEIGMIQIGSDKLSTTHMRTRKIELSQTPFTQVSTIEIDQEIRMKLSPAIPLFRNALSKQIKLFLIGHKILLLFLFRNHCLHERNTVDARFFGSANTFF